MSSRLSELLPKLETDHKNYRPVFFRMSDPEQGRALETLILSGSVQFSHDEILGQLQELVKIAHPSKKINQAEYPDLISDHLQGIEISDYGVWVYYPWNKRLVHILDENEFVKVRTNRNQYKITGREQQQLASKKIGIVGLSVGQSIALTLSMERGFGELRLTDFDTLELSNLNRIRTGVHNLGIPKVVIAAREIAEIDPFLNVRCFFSGLDLENMDEFLLKDGKLDILIDECDSLDVKILSRFRARELGIPVLMDTSDRGMLDVERFDLEPERPLLHGTIENIDPHTIKGLSTEDKIPIMLQMLGIENISLRAKTSMLEVEQTINTWPQLASSVALGGAVGADVCRRILLNQFHQSGRYYVDLDQLVADPPVPKKLTSRANPFTPLTENEMVGMIKNAHFKSGPSAIKLKKSIISKLVEAAGAAPSTGNDQPWKWVSSDETLFLFHDEVRSFSFGDFQKTASFISFGAAFENLYIKALEYNIEAIPELFPDRNNERLVAAIQFIELPIPPTEIKNLGDAIFRRHTNRILAPKESLPTDFIQKLTKATQSISDIKIKFFSSPQDMMGLAKIIGACDKMRLLNEEGHYDFVHREMRWTSKDAERTRDGIDIKTLGLGHSLQAALNVIRSEEVISELNSFGGGNALGMLATRTVSTASALCMISLPGYSLENFFKGGRAMERFWLEATKLKLAIHPLISPIYFFARLLHGNGEGLSKENIKELKILRKQFEDITGTSDTECEVFLTKIAIAPEPELKAHRLDLQEILTYKE